jgi:hypothetical protein
MDAVTQKDAGNSEVAVGNGCGQLRSCCGQRLRATQKLLWAKNARNSEVAAAIENLQ